MRLVIAAPATWLLAASVIGPAPNQETFKRSITAARQFFGRQEYERALKHLSYMQQMALGQEERAAVVLYEGLILASLGWRQQARASSSFMTALLLTPQAKLPLKTSPQVERHFEEMRARILKDVNQRLHQRQVSSAQDSLTLSAHEAPSPEIPMHQRSMVPEHSHLMPEPEHREKEFEYFVSTARQFLEEEEYERALECLQQAQQSAFHDDHRTTVALYEGIIFLNLGRRQQARAASSFMLALTLAPQMQLPIKTSAQVERDFEEIRTRVLRDLSSRPPFAPPSSGTQHFSSNLFSLAWALDVPEHVRAHILREFSYNREFSYSAPTALPDSDTQSSPGSSAPQHLTGGVLGGIHHPSEYPRTVLPAPVTQGTPSHPFPAPLPHKASETRERINDGSVLGPAMLGAGFLISGGVFWGLAKNQQSRLRRIDPSRTPLEDAQRIASQGKFYQGLSFVLLGVGTMAVGATVSMYWLGESEASMTLDVGTNGTTISAYGRWP